MRKIKRVATPRFLGIFSVMLVGTILYSNTLNSPFIFDDYSSIVDNDAIKNFKTSFGNISNNRYLSLLSFAFNYAAGGLKPFGYHLVNNIIHIINALLVYYLVVLTFRTPVMSASRLSEQFVAVSAAFIFISHPIQTQAVTYIAQRATSMATMFYLTSVILYVKARLAAGQKSGLRVSRYMIYAACVITAVFAMKSKEIAVTLPLIIVLYEFCFFNGQSGLKRFLYLLPLLLIVLIIPFSMLDFTKSTGSIAENLDVQSRETVSIGRSDYLFTQFRVIVTYLRLLVLPINQSLDYRYPVYHFFGDPQVFLSFLVLLSILSLGAYLFYHSRFTVHGSRSYASRLIAFGIFWFFITLSVESSIIPIKDVIVEHRLYLPSIGFFIAFVLSIEHFFSNMRLKTALMVAIVLVLSLSTYNRNAIWQDPQKLWEDVISKSPNNVRAYTELGAIFRDEGQYAEAMNQFEKALKINKNYVLTYYNIGYIQYKLENYKNALMYFRKTLEFNLPSLIRMETFNSLGMTYSEMGNDVDAINAFKEAIQTLPTSIIPYNNLGRQYIKMGNFDGAIEILKKGLEIREEPHLRSNLSTACAMKAEKEKNSGKTKK